MGQSTRCRWGSKEIITNINRICMVFLLPARAATNFCLESVWELDLSESWFGNLLVCYTVLPVPSPRRVASNPATLSSTKAPSGYPNKNSNNRKTESARGATLFFPFPLPIVPRALSFSISPALPAIQRGLYRGERSSKVKCNLFQAFG